MASHPFDARRSGRDPFPCFEATMRQLGDSDDDSDSHYSHRSSSSDNDWDATTGGDGDGGCCCEEEDACDGACGEAAPRRKKVTLRWSIDALATLLPLEFSPLPHQKRLPTPSPATAPRVSHRTPDQIQTQTHRRRRRRRWSAGSGGAWTPPSTGGRTPTFFEDETQFRVLRTPAAVIEREQLQQMQQQSGERGGSCSAEYTRWRAPEAMRWRELHRRCVETMQLCEERLRERQHKLRRIPIPPSKLKLRRRSPGSSHSSGSTKSATNRSDAVTPLRVGGSAVSTPSRDPLTPVVATRLSFGSIDLSPIPVDTAEKKRAETIAVASPLSQQASLPVTPAVATQPRPAYGSGASSFSSPAPSLSSIAEHPHDVLTPSFASLRFAMSDNDDEEEKENKENDEPSSSSSSSGDVSASSLNTMSLLRASRHSFSSSSSSSSPFTPPSLERSASRGTTFQAEEEKEENAAIAKRQLSFLAAIEEEAQARDASKTHAVSESATEESESDAATDDSGAQRRPFAGGARLPPPAQPLQRQELKRTGPPATSMASIYKEARALGITEPTAQWEYVQLISKQTASQRRPR